MFDATKSKFRDITFETVNLDENKDLAGKYNVSSIPRLIMIDGSGNAIYNDTPPQSEDALASLIGQHH